LQFLHRQNFNTNIDHVSDVEGEVLNKQVIGHKGILAELDFDSHAAFDEISLIVRVDRLESGGLDFRLLLVGGHMKRLPD
jgi:hypothetical protein